MNTRLIIAIVTTVLEEAAIAAIALWLLPQFDIYLPLAVLIVIMAVWLGYAVFTYQMGSRALKKKPEIGLSDMVGSRGTVVKHLDPEGMVRIRGETWKAKAAGGKIGIGEEVIVVERERLKLIVERINPQKKPE